jgi:hypothetical protein
MLSMGLFESGIEIDLIVQTVGHSFWTFHEESIAVHLI